MPSALAASTPRWYSADDEPRDQVAAQQRAAERVEAHHVAVVAKDLGRLIIARPPRYSDDLRQQPNRDNHAVNSAKAAYHDRQHGQAADGQAHQRQRKA